MNDDSNVAGDEARPVRPMRRVLLGVLLLALVLFTTGASGVFAFVVCDGCGSQRSTLQQLPKALEEGPTPKQPDDTNPKAGLLPPPPEAANSTNR